MKRPIDIDAQFEKLFPGWMGDRSDMLVLIEHAVERERNLGAGEHRCYYDLNKHLALTELRDALKAEISHAD